MELWWQVTAVSTEHQVKKCRGIMGFSLLWISLLTVWSSLKDTGRDQGGFTGEIPVYAFLSPGIPAQSIK